MELKEFVSATLVQILEGVADAQEHEFGRNINADAGALPEGNKVFSRGVYGTHTIVDFDIAVQAENTGKGGANLKVFGIGAEAGGERKTGQANRIAFSLTVRLPEASK